MLELLDGMKDVTSEELMDRDSRNGGSVAFLGRLKTERDSALFPVRVVPASYADDMSKIETGMSSLLRYKEAKFSEGMNLEETWHNFVKHYELNVDVLGTMLFSYRTFSDAEKNPVAKEFGADKLRNVMDVYVPDSRGYVRESFSLVVDADSGKIHEYSIISGARYNKLMCIKFMSGTPDVPLGKSEGYAMLRELLESQINQEIDAERNVYL